MSELDSGICQPLFIKPPALPEQSVKSSFSRRSAGPGLQNQLQSLLLLQKKGKALLDEGCIDVDIGAQLHADSELASTRQLALLVPDCSREQDGISFRPSNRAVNVPPSQTNTKQANDIANKLDKLRLLQQQAHSLFA